MPNILLIDSYDSFTFNLADLIRTSIPLADVHIIHNDSLSPPHLLSLLPSFDAVVVGPGPGSPDDPESVGIIPTLWSLSDDQLVPVFGVCLGHQSLCLAFGGSLRRLRDVKHGLKSLLEYNSADIFKGAQDPDVVRYHSLHVDIAACSDLTPLAWALDEHDDSSTTHVLMAAKHLEKPFWGVQYHPESVCTSEGGAQVLKNFWTLASQWNQEHNRVSLPSLPLDWKDHLTPSSRALHPLPLVPRSAFASPSASVHYTKIIPNDRLDRSIVPRLCETLRGSNNISAQDDFVVLDSSASPGRYSIIGLIMPDTSRFEYTMGDAFISERTASTSSRAIFQDGDDVWQWLARYMDTRKCSNGSPDSPFWGGLLGIANYEAGVTSLDIPLPSRPQGRHRPDISFAFIERSIVLDFSSGSVYVQSIGLEQAVETTWITSTAALLKRIIDPAFTPAPTPPISPDLDSTQRAPPAPPRSHIKVEMPSEDRYISGILQAQEFLKAGDSYEICLTALTRITLQPNISGPSVSPVSHEYLPWRLFKVLRVLNPAAHGSYMRLGGITLVGSSPERFVSWTRGGLCQLRPIKGTIKKSRPGQPDVTRAEAEEFLLGSPKEIAENLMIVDLIRHDLHRVVSAHAIQDTPMPLPVNATRRSVEVTKLFAVEETETVFHLVTVIEGCVDVAQGYTGWDVLSRSLPPGSMTGAPKKRSVELLQELEFSPGPTPSSTPHERGVYSGVCGYWCVGGGGDFSVIIRSAFRYDDELGDDGTETWYVGAGGAITALSNPHDEWDEMKTKLSSALRAFSHV
ncbi:para-aminobenzoate synthase [Clavulina sp. PMI_390]|nr:para-aminobenzoate synthase [Clavulina sp. PMI_390]